MVVMEAMPTTFPDQHETKLNGACLGAVEGAPRAVHHGAIRVVTVGFSAVKDALSAPRSLQLQMLCSELVNQ
jgi:hypothetical protein